MDAKTVLLTLIGWLVFFSTLIVDITTDGNLWLKARNKVKTEGAVNHGGLGLVLRCVGIFISILLIGWSAIWSPILYWGLMDIGFNIKTNQKWSRIGETAKLDKLQRKFPPIIWIKFIGGIAGIVWYFIKLI